MDFGARVHALRTAEPLHDRWWLTLLVPYVVLVVIGPPCHHKIDQQHETN